MADIIVSDNVPARTVQQEISLNSLPPELLVKFIFSDCSLVSLMRLSATSRYFRLLVHSIFTSCLSAQAARHPEVRASLARIGWTKDHNLWTCSCFKLVAGPAVTWGDLKERKVFSAICQSNNLEKISTIVAGKTFLIKPDYAVIYWDNATGSKSSCSLISSNNGRINNLSSYDNVIAFVVSSNHRSINIYNPRNMKKIADIDLYGRESGLEGIIVSVDRITFSENTMLVRLKTFTTAFTTHIQIWKLDTKDPQEEGIGLLQTISHRNAPISRYISFYEPICINDSFIALMDHEELKVFSRDEEPTFIRQIGLYGKAPERIALEKRCGDLVALAFVLNYKNGVQKLRVEVYSVSRGYLVIRKELNHSPCPELLNMNWFGPHLVVVFREDNVLSVMSWQPGLASFLMCPVRVPWMRRSSRGKGRGGDNWNLECLNIDYEGVTCAIYDRYPRYEWRSDDQTVYFKTWDSR